MPSARSSHAYACTIPRAPLTGCSAGRRVPVRLYASRKALHPHVHQRWSAPPSRPCTSDTQQPVDDSRDAPLRGATSDPNSSHLSRRFVARPTRLCAVPGPGGNRSGRPGRVLLRRDPPVLWDLDRANLIHTLTFRAEDFRGDRTDVEAHLKDFDDALARLALPALEEVVVILPEPEEAGVYMAEEASVYTAVEATLRRAMPLLEQRQALRVLWTTTEPSFRGWNCDSTEDVSMGVYDAVCRASTPGFLLVYVRNQAPFFVPPVVVETVSTRK
ncbi:hypothetical protein B0H17DRAFT_200860 [Mycena rosella]|uniref:Uncharacterized protein n=1 Tax=Mycena rosella TaxID=1033263 RepID=A0AAD7GLZ0_MYCRO|nr:hypothetical protein B0H17DRAFT_200860 [Mycena rosella]